jgi:uncharacterized protein YjiS (DUF1127 family)|tara:strand:+ start:17 stop:226 length:210 start_codon:yes stop_codon:yes gene_type:complete
MTTYNTNSTTFGTTLVAARISGAVHSAIDAAVFWNNARLTRNALTLLSNRELEDIGLSRGDIETVARTR